MPTPRKKPRRAHKREGPRVSITFTLELYRTIGELARQKKVSIAWVVRDAAAKYVEEQIAPSGAG